MIKQFTTQLERNMVDISAVRRSESTGINISSSIPNAFLVSSNSSDWIIDTGAINYMMSDINILNKNTIIENAIPKKVYLGMVILHWLHTLVTILFLQELLLKMCFTYHNLNTNCCLYPRSLKNCTVVSISSPTFVFFRIL